MAAPRDATPFYLALRAFSFVALAAIALAIAYTGWISISNWKSTGG
jgi:hypothetical protein